MAVPYQGAFKADIGFAEQITNTGQKPYWLDEPAKNGGRYRSLAVNRLASGEKWGENPAGLPAKHKFHKGGVEDEDWYMRFCDRVKVAANGPHTYCPETSLLKKGFGYNALPKHHSRRVFVKMARQGHSFSEGNLQVMREDPNARRDMANRYKEVMGGGAGRPRANGSSANAPPAPPPSNPAPPTCPRSPGSSLPSAFSIPSVYSETSRSLRRERGPLPSLAVPSTPLSKSASSDVGKIKDSASAQPISQIKQSASGLSADAPISGQATKEGCQAPTPCDGGSVLSACWSAAKKAPGSAVSAGKPAASSLSAAAKAVPTGSAISACAPAGSRLSLRAPDTEEPAASEVSGLPPCLKPAPGVPMSFWSHKSASDSKLLGEAREAPQQQKQVASSQRKAASAVSAAAASAASSDYYSWRPKLIR